MPAFVKFDIETAKREILQKESRESRESRGDTSNYCDNKKIEDSISNTCDVFKSKISGRSDATFATPATQGPENRLTNALEQACLNLALKPKQFWRFLSLEDIDDISNGLIDLNTLRAYAERFNSHPYLVPVGNSLPYPAPLRHERN